MLVLSRKAGESFVIGDNIVVTVVRIVGGGVRLGIEAPVDYSVVRKELYLGDSPLGPRPAAPRDELGDPWRDDRPKELGS